MELFIAVVALAVALWQLKLQRDEAHSNSQVNALIHVADLLNRKIDLHEEIIEGMRSKGDDWQGHAAYVNKQLRPLLTHTNAKLLACLEGRLPDFDIVTLKQSLRLAKAGSEAD